MEKHMLLRSILFKRNINTEKLHDVIWPYLLDFNSYDINVFDSIILKNNTFENLRTILWPYNNNFYQEILENYEKTKKSNKRKFKEGNIFI